MPDRYDPARIEGKWQAQWEADGLHRISEDSARPKWYALALFSSVSEHLTADQYYALIPSDVQARYRRMRGYNVLFPIGFDAFGLPAQNAAVQSGANPREWTMRNIEAMREEIRALGCMFDWEREIVTCEPEFYHWTQWLFIQLYREGYAYRAKAPCKWCPNCQLALAEEQVTAEGECRRCGTRVIERQMEAWLFKTAQYADELLLHDGLEWPEAVQEAQRTLIGRSEHIEVDFDISHESRLNPALTVTTARPELAYAATYVALAPEHPMAKRLTKFQQRAAVDAYAQAATQMSEAERRSPERERTGVFAGSYCVNVATGEKVPIWIADYLTKDGALGAMGVPAHDERDFAFARRYDLPAKVVVAPPDWSGTELAHAHEGDGCLVNSGPFDGLPAQEARESVLKHMEEQGFGRYSVSYRMGDKVVSRQGYWGTPIPFVYCNMCGIIPVNEQNLPLLLPDIAELRPSGESPYKYSEQHRTTICPKCHSRAERDTDTLDNLVCSSWYFLRHTSPGVDDLPFDLEKSDYWLPVDHYAAPADGATGHLLYARFFWKALRDLGVVRGDEPFPHLTAPGPLATSDGTALDVAEWVREFGADAVRLCLLGIGPWEKGGAVNRAGAETVFGWLQEVHSLALSGDSLPAVGDSAADADLTHATCQLAADVSTALEGLQHERATSALYGFTKRLRHAVETRRVTRAAWRGAIDMMLLLLAPIAPHLAEELWEKTGQRLSIHTQPWPLSDTAS